MNAIIITVAFAVVAIQVGILLGIRAEAKREREALRQLLLATRPRASEVSQPIFQQIQELPQMTAQERLVFYRSVVDWSGWKRFSHIFQAETRSNLAQARAAAIEGKDAGAIFLSGAAWATANMAVMPEARAYSALEAVRAEQIEAQIAKATAGSNDRDRPPWMHVR
jgi:hypothetical protein